MRRLELGERPARALAVHVEHEPTMAAEQPDVRARRDALVAVIVGERFPEWQRAGASELCDVAGVPLSRMHWEHGRPFVLNAPTLDPSDSD